MLAILHSILAAHCLQRSVHRSSCGLLHATCTVVRYAATCSSMDVGLAFGSVVHAYFNVRVMFSDLMLLGSRKSILPVISCNSSQMFTFGGPSLVVVVAAAAVKLLLMLLLANTCCCYPQKFLVDESHFWWPGLQGGHSSSKVLESSFKKTFSISKALESLEYELGA